MASNKYAQIRVKGLQFLGQKSIAIYIYNITSQIESLLLQNDNDHILPL